MNDANDNVKRFGPRLSEVIRDVKSAAADRADVVIEMREAERMRLELLANELAPVIAEVPDGVDIFDFAVSSGLQPRFWIDAVSHVSMGRDKRTYRFVKDTRLGRAVLAESTDMKTVANQVTRYLAERLVERERLMEGGVTDFSGRYTVEQKTAKRPSMIGSLLSTRSETASTADAAANNSGEESDRPINILTGILLLAAGVATGLIAAALLYWDRLGFNTP